MKRAYWLLISWTLVAAVAVMIFLFSAQNGEISSQTSEGVVQWLLQTFYPDFESLSEPEKTTLIESWHFAVRKVAHFTEFALLGISVRLLFYLLLRRHPSLWAWIAGTLYACTDELHQTLVGDRAGMWQDVCIDSAGVLFGVLAALLLLYFRKKRNGRKIA